MIAIRHYTTLSVVSMSRVRMRSGGTSVEAGNSAVIDKPATESVEIQRPALMDRFGFGVRE